MIKLVSDSSCDLYEFPAMPFQAVPLTISTDRASFRDDASLNLTEMLDYLKSYNGRSYTACPSIDDWMSAFSGADQVCAITITSGLSGSYNSAVAARELFLQKHPDVKIRIFDSLSTGPELCLLMEKLAELTAQGLDFDIICHETEAYQERTRLFFSLHSVHNLAQNGRVSKVAAAAVGVMGIRIVGTASPEGTLATISKCRGDRKALPELLKQMDLAGYTGGKVRISHVQNPELAETFSKMLLAKYPDADIRCYSAGGLCSYYAELGSLLIGMETGKD